MRVVMVTDDIIIDRRILLEAEELAKKNNDVIIIAGWEKGLEQYSIYKENIKIERVSEEMFTLQSIEVKKKSRIDIKKYKLIYLFAKSFIKNFITFIKSRINEKKRIRKIKKRIVKKG